MGDPSSLSSPALNLRRNRRELSGAANYVDRILRGTKVADLPFQEATQIKLAINLRTARSIKITVPPFLLTRADEVIE